MKEIALLLYRYLRKNTYDYYEEDDWSRWQLVMMDEKEYELKSDSEIKEMLKSLNPFISIADVEYKIVEDEKLLKLAR